MAANPPPSPGLEKAADDPLPPRVHRVAAVLGVMVVVALLVIWSWRPARGEDQPDRGAGRAVATAPEPVAQPRWVTQVMAAGALVVALGFMGSLLQRRAVLEREVQRRTRDLRRSESLQHALLEALPVGVMLIDRESGMVERANARAAEMLGANLETLVGTVTEAFRAPASLGSGPVTMEEVSNVEQEVAGPGGRLVPILKSIRRLDLDGREKVLTTFVDITDQKQAAAAAARQHSLLKTILDTTPGFLVLKDPAGAYRLANHAFCRFVGRTHEEVIGRTDFDLFPAEEAALFRSADERAMQTGESLALDELVTAGRERRWLHVIKSPVRNEAGTAIGVLCSVLDITDRRQAEEEIRRQATLISSLVDSIPDLIFFKDCNGVYLGCNAAFAAFVGRTREQIVGWSDVDFFSPPVAREFRENDRRMLELKQARRNEEWVTYPGGQRVLLDTLKTPYWAADGAVLGIIGISRDITERRRAEDALRRSESRLRAITDSAQDAIVMMDPAGNIEFWNPAAERMFGYRQEEIQGKNLHQLLAPERYHSAHERAIEGFRQHGAGCAVGRVTELSARRRDGMEFPVELSLSGIHLDDGWHAVGLVRDISRRKQTEDALLHTNRQLEQTIARSNQLAKQAMLANVAKSEFLANMSHEIRTPMNGVIGMNRLLLGTSLQPLQRQYAETACSSAETLLQLIDDILDFSRVEAGRLELDTVEFEVRTLVNDFTRMMAFRAAEKKIGLSCAVDEAVPERLSGDPGRVRQVITNLVGNALKFTHRGEITIRIGVDESGPDHCVLRVIVRDTGIGIPPEKLPLLFQKFSQVDASVTRRYGGSGLGLAISRQLVQLMKGDIGVASTPGEGSEFWFTVRLGQVPESRPALRNADPKPRTGVVSESPFTRSHRWRERGVRVLLAEDNLVNQQVAQGILHSLGIAVDAVGDGAEVLRALEAGTYDLVLMDVQMPEMDGLEATRRIREREAALREGRSGTTTVAGALPIVAMTAHALPRDRDLCLRAGMDDYLTKPVDPAGLERVLERWLGDGRKVTAASPPPPAESQAAEARQGESTVVFDRAALVERTLGDPSLLQAVQEAFLAETPADLRDLQELAQAGDLERTSVLAHKVKGAAATVSAEALRLEISEIEKAAREGEVGEVRRRVSGLPAEFERLAAAMRSA